MGVDRIGQGGPPAPVPETGGASRATPAGSAFQVQPSAAAPAAAPAASASSALERFRAGEVDVGGYVDLKVDEATAHLSAALPAGQLEAIRNTLRERISSDPSLAELLQSATGEALPPPTHDD
jgi:hypothetical protein